MQFLVNTIHTTWNNYKKTTYNTWQNIVHPCAIAQTAFVFICKQSANTLQSFWVSLHPWMQLVCDMSLWSSSQVFKNYVLSVSSTNHEILMVWLPPHIANWLSYCSFNASLIKDGSWLQVVVDLLPVFETTTISKATRRQVHCTCSSFGLCLSLKVLISPMWPSGGAWF